MEIEETMAEIHRARKKSREAKYISAVSLIMSIMALIIQLGFIR